MFTGSEEKLAVNTDKTRPGEPGWMEGFGKLRRLRKETQRIQARIVTHLDRTT